MALEVLRAGETILVAPEGTRNPEMQRGKEGIAYLSSRSRLHHSCCHPGYNWIPGIAFFSSLREPGVYIKFGKPFSFDPAFSRAGREDLRKWLMRRCMSWLQCSQNNLGLLSGFSKATQDTIICRSKIPSSLRALNPQKWIYYADDNIIFENHPFLYMPNGIIGWLGWLGLLSLDVFC